MLFGGLRSCKEFVKICKRLSIRLILELVDVQSVTPEVTYLEGVWVNPHLRGKHIGLACFNQLERKLLNRTSRLSQSDCISDIEFCESVNCEAATS
jgi:Acetyltransferase (GNAT) family